MAQIIKHRRGSLESLSAVTSSLQKGEIVIASGSSNLTVTNGASIVFAVPADGQVQAVNRFLVGASAPNTFAANTYNGMLKGVPYYASGSSTLYLLGEGANEIPDLTGNISNFSSSVATSINALSSSIGGGSIGNSVTLLNTFSGSQLTQNSTLATYTGSVDTRLTQIGVVSGSLISSASAAAIANANQNTFTASVDTRLTTIGTYTGSVNTRLTEVGVVTGSLISSASTAAIANANQNTFTASAATRLTEIGVVTGSLISSASNVLSAFNSFSSSFDTAFNLSGANVTIAGNLTVAGTQTIVDSTTVQIGDNIIELNGSGAANGGLLVKDPTSPNTVSGSLLWDSTNDYWKGGAAGAESKFLRAGGDNVVTESAQILFTGIQGFTTYDSAISTITGSLISSASAAKTTNDSQGVSITNLNTTSASVNVSIANLNNFTSSNNSTTLLNSHTASANTRFTEIGVVSGSLIASASAAKTTNDSQGVSITNLNTATASLLIDTANLEAFSASALTRLTSLETETSNLETFSGSQLTKDSALATITGSLITSASTAKTTNDSQGVSITNLNTTTASLNSFSSSQLSKDSTLATYTGSVDTRLTQIGVVSGSLISSASNASSRLTTLEGTGTIQGLGTSNNVTFAKVTTTGDVVVGGDLVVQGNTVTLNTAQLVVEDKVITLASGSTSSATADGAGIEIAGASANFVYQHSSTSFTSSVSLIAPAVTASVNLGSAAGSSKRIAFRTTNGNLDLVPTASVAGDLLQWNGSDFVMSNVIDGGSF